MENDLETIYENMMTPVMLRVIKQTLPLNALDAEESTREEEEDLEEYENDEDENDCDKDSVAESHVEVARDILSVVSDLDDLAKEAMYKSFRKKIERCADKIRDLANEIIEDHGYKV
jgi:hypothetical protein